MIGLAGAAAAAGTFGVATALAYRLRLRRARGASGRITSAMAAIDDSDFYSPMAAHAPRANANDGSE